MTIGISSDVASWVQDLRAMALILTGDLERADDLVERTIICALARPKERRPGLKANVWMLSTLHKCYWTEQSEDRLANQASGRPYRGSPAEFDDFWEAFWRLAGFEREVLILVEACDLSYEEVAQVYSSSIGAITQRFAGARRELVRTLSCGPEGTYSKKRLAAPAAGRQGRHYLR